MAKEFSSISELKSIREQKSRLSERENELSTPVLTDLSLIQEIYVWFNPNRSLERELSFISNDRH